MKTQKTKTKHLVQNGRRPPMSGPEDTTAINGRNIENQHLSGVCRGVPRSTGPPSEGRQGIMAGGAVCCCGFGGLVPERAAAGKKSSFATP